ncbi:MAG: hypothetical protein LBS81_02950 [Endomicrobium sp.]|jgi:hypothetical protein|nr:hypothetical protein [Endomicrobium sp.]
MGLPSGIYEKVVFLRPLYIVRDIAYKKALSILKISRFFILSADTLVV